LKESVSATAYYDLGKHAEEKKKSSAVKAEKSLQ
jgi:hypothetical protein